jgi:hypothetical protein
MHLNAKLQGLKYNFKKVQAVKCKFSRGRYFLVFIELFFLR